MENASIGVVGKGEDFHVLTQSEVAPYVRAQVSLRALRALLARSYCAFSSRGCFVSTYGNNNNKARPRPQP